jgi:hypothetical protein
MRAALAASLTSISALSADVPDGEREENWRLGDPDARHRRHRQFDLHFLPAPLAPRLQGRPGGDWPKAKGATAKPGGTLDLPVASAWRGGACR